MSIVTSDSVVVPVNNVRSSPNTGQARVFEFRV